MKKFILLALTLLTVCGALSGCEYKELDRITIVAGMALDGKPGDLTLNAELLYTKEGTDMTLESEIVEAKGATLLEAMTNADLMVSNRLYWSHTQLIIVSEDLAKNGLEQIISQVREHSNLRVDISFVIARDIDPKEVFSLKTHDEDVTSIGIQKMLKEARDYGTIPQFQLYKFNKLKQQEGQAGILPFINEYKSGGEHLCKVGGCAVFYQDKLAGYLDEEQTFSLMMGRGEAENGMFLCTVPQGNVEMQIKGSSSDIKAYLDNEVPHADISIKFKMKIKESNSTSLLEKEYIKQIKSAAEQKIKSDLEKTLDYLINELNADALGVGKHIYISDKKNWEKIHDRWETEFLKRLECKISVNVDIIGSNAVFGG